jgi:hypothetical protein
MTHSRHRADVFDVGDVPKADVSNRSKNACTRSPRRRGRHPDILECRDTEKWAGGDIFVNVEFHSDLPTILGVKPSRSFMEAVGQHGHFNFKACGRVNRKSFAGDGERRLGAGFHCRDELTETARSRLSCILYCLLAEAQTTEISRLADGPVKARRQVF